MSESLNLFYTYTNIKTTLLFILDELDDTRARVQKSADEAILLKSKLTDVQKNADEKSEMVVDLQGRLLMSLITCNYVDHLYWLLTSLMS